MRSVIKIMRPQCRETLRALGQGVRWERYRTRAPYDVQCFLSSARAWRTAPSLAGLNEIMMDIVLSGPDSTVGKAHAAGSCEAGVSTGCFCAGCGTAETVEAADNRATSDSAAFLMRSQTVLKSVSGSVFRKSMNL